MATTYYEESAAARDGDLARQFDLLWRYRRSLLAVFAAILVLGAIIVAIIPASYRSTATILIEQQQIPQDLVRTTVTGFAEERIQVLAQRVMTGANLMAIIKRHDLYAKERRYEPREVILERMRNDIDLGYISADVVDPRNARIASATIAFTLAYRSDEPAVAFRVANELTSLFLSENLKNRTQMAEDTSRFLQEEADRLRGRVDDLDAQLAAYRSEHFDSLPEFSQTTLQLLDRADREATATRADIDSLNERILLLRSRIAQSTDDGRYVGDNPRGFLLTPAQQHTALEAELSRALTTYTEDHPDVRRLRRELAALDAPTGGGALDDTRFGDAVEGAVRNAIDGNVMALQTQLDSAVLQRNAQQQRLTELERLREDYRSRLDSSPEVEGDYRVLTRDYESASNKYREIRAKLLEANLAQALEVERKAERFTLIEPPMRPEEPVWPNRPALLFLTLVLSVGGAVAFGAVRGSLDKSIHGVRGARAALPHLQIMPVPSVVTLADRLVARRRLMALGGGAGVALMALLAFVHLSVSPLGTLWLAALRRAGL